MALVSIMDTIIKLRISKHDFKHLCIGWCNLKKNKKKRGKRYEDVFSRSKSCSRTGKVSKV